MKLNSLGVFPEQTDGRVIIDGVLFLTPVPEVPKIFHFVVGFLFIFSSTFVERFTPRERTKRRVQKKK